MIHNPIISVSGYRSDPKRDVHCYFEFTDHKVDIHVPNAVAASDGEREDARRLLLSIAEALAKALTH